MNNLPPAPKLGPPIHYIHVIWLAARADDPQEFFDELDADRWSIRSVRLYRYAAHVACSYDSPNWRDVMPEAAIDEPEIINRDTQFRARAISRKEFEAAWEAAQPENPLRFNVVDGTGQFLCPCCGLAGQFSNAPYRRLGGEIGCGICACCLWEPGFDDHAGASADAKSTIKASLLAYRAEWIAEGCPWRAAMAAPADWNGRTQCERLLAAHPHLTDPHEAS
jgi:hypothetical protein